MLVETLQLQFLVQTPLGTQLGFFNLLFGCPTVNFGSFSKEQPH